MANDQLDRLKIVINELIKRGEVKNPTDFARKINFDLGYFSLIRNAKRPVPTELIIDVAEYYKINFEYISKGESPIFKGQTDQKLNSATMKEDHPMFKMMQQLIENNTTVTKTNEMLAKEILSLIKNGGIAEFQAKT